VIKIKILYCKEATVFVKLSSIQISKLNNRPTVRNLIKTGSQTSSLIDHKCQQSFIATDVFPLPNAVVDVDRRCCGFRPTLAHTLSLSLSLRYLALFPLLSVWYKNPGNHFQLINWNTDFDLLACSHFKGNISAKVFIKK
jgi:hypothetical protein